MAEGVDEWRLQMLGYVEFYDVPVQVLLLLVCLVLGMVTVRVLR